MQEVAEHFVVWGSDIDPSALESIKQYVQSKQTLLFIIWYDPRFKGNPDLARLASDLASCDVLFRPTPAYVRAEIASEYRAARPLPMVPWASASDMLRAWELEKGGEAA